MLDFTSLYEKYAADVFRFALYLSGNRTDAEDIVSETFVRVWTSEEPTRSETAKSYLFTIARNLFLKSIRHSSRRDPLCDDLLDSGPTAHEQLEQRVEMATVLKAMKRLPESDRAALIMRTLDELPYKEIAAVLNISETAAKVKVHRARAWLMNIRKV